MKLAQLQVHPLGCALQYLKKGDMHQNINLQRQAIKKRLKKLSESQNNNSKSKQS